MLDDIKNLYIVTCNGFNTEKGYFFKEISLYNHHIKYHWTVKLPTLDESNEKEQNQILFCTKYIHGLQFQNNNFDLHIFQIKDLLIKMKRMSPEANFVVKGDYNLKKFLTHRCKLECVDLESFGCPKYDPLEVAKFDAYPFCSLHEREKCCYARAAWYFYWVLVSY